MFKVKRLSRIVVFVYIFIPLFETITAQDNDSAHGVRTNELIVVDSKPTGAIVQLKGLYHFTGRTPFIVPYSVRGYYKIKTTKEGYESVTTDVHFVGGKEKSLLIKLSPRTRFKAAYRSLFFPGWGQVYGGHKVRGVLINTLQIALGIRTLIAVNDYYREQDDFERAQDRFDRNMTEASFQDLQNELEDAEDAYNLRNTMLIITASFWAYNILDSIIFFSPKSSQIEIKTVPRTDRFTLKNRNVLLSWKIEF
ncbi:MAG: DUF5683 domain-containing protein [bacterium]